MGGYDLYGNYYPNSSDALNAEMAQCNEIDNNINQKKVKETKTELDHAWDMLMQLKDKIKQLEIRIEQLEGKQ